jgi:hypothetical protein
MGQNKEKAFASPREVFRTYFPSRMNEREGVSGGESAMSSRDLGVEELAEEFAASLNKKQRK